jgi:hypothetical protein
MPEEPDVTPRVDYDELVRSYHGSLTTVLRGFTAGEEFLDTWVPDDDHHKSILNLVESGESAGLDGVIISIGATTRRSLDLAKLQLMIEPIGTVRTQADGEALVLEVRYE